MWWIVRETRHHNVEMPDFYVNVQAETENEAILEAYRTAIRSHLQSDNLKIPDISAILSQEELQVTVIDLECPDEPIEFVIWNQNDDEHVNRGVGLGSNIYDIDKSENRWIDVEPRTDENLHNALKGYQGEFEKLPAELIQQVLQHLDKEENNS